MNHRISEQEIRQLRAEREEAVDAYLAARSHSELYSSKVQEPEDREAAHRIPDRILLAMLAGALLGMTCPPFRVLVKQVAMWATGVSA